jgi:hypothetical protein
MGHGVGSALGFPVFAQLPADTARPRQYGNIALIRRFGGIRPRLRFGRLGNCQGRPKDYEHLQKNETHA